MSLSDFDLFLSSMEDVTPLNQDLAQTHHLKSSPTLSQQEKRKAAEADLSIEEDYLRSETIELLPPDSLLSYKKPGVQEGVYKNLRLAKYQIDATLDLHGQALKAARQILFNFILDCHNKNIRVVLIRHGIGIKNKKTPGVLKSYTNKWLTEIRCVLAFHSALKQHGGQGATYVLLKKNEEKKHENRELHAKR